MVCHGLGVADLEKDRSTGNPAPSNTTDTCWIFIQNNIYNLFYLAGGQLLTLNKNFNLGLYTLQSAAVLIL